ncbi:MAG: hypothetical protein QW358_02490 [Candidatus Hadarchaeum sp.]
MKSKLFLLSLTIIVFIASCANVPTQVNKTETTAVESTSITLTPSLGALIGQVKSAATGEPIANITVRLATVHWNENKTDGAFVLEGGTSPGDITSENGVFEIINLKPADYVIVVGDVIGRHEIISNPDGSAKIFTIEEDMVLEIEPLIVNLP